MEMSGPEASETPKFDNVEVGEIPENLENPEKPQEPPKTDVLVEKKVEKVEEDVKFFKTKKIRFGPIEYKIVTQNLNGPCPLIALINVLVLKGKIEIPSTPIVTSTDLLTRLTDIILSRTPNSENPEDKEIFENNLKDVLNIIGTIVKGLDVNVKFSGVADFEFTPVMSLFDLVSVSLYHVWLPDPQFKVINDLVGNLNYNELVVKMCEEPSDETQILQNFHEETISQITFHGLATLMKTMKDGELAVLFQNNHFSTILKRRDEIFKLVSDEGLADEPNIIWETFSDVDGDCIFVNADFGNFKSPAATICPHPIDNSPIEEAVEAIERPASVPIPAPGPSMARSQTADEFRPIQTARPAQSVQHHQQRPVEKTKNCVVM